MEADPRKQLREQLGQEVVEGLGALSEDQLALLASALSEARKAQSEALNDAAERSLRHVPRLLRGAAKKIVFG